MIDLLQCLVTGSAFEDASFKSFKSARTKMAGPIISEGKWSAKPKVGWSSGGFGLVLQGRPSKSVDQISDFWEHHQHDSETPDQPLRIQLKAGVYSHIGWAYEINMNLSVIWDILRLFINFSAHESQNYTGIGEVILRTSSLWKSMAWDQRRICAPLQTACVVANFTRHMSLLPATLETNVPCANLWSSWTPWPIFFHCIVIVPDLIKYEIQSY